MAFNVNLKIDDLLFNIFCGEVPEILFINFEVISCFTRKKQKSLITLTNWLN